jgi:hypothetical protein
VLSKSEAKVAHAIYYSMETVYQKSQMIRRVLEVTGDNKEREILETLMDAVKKVHTPRNELAHALLFTEDADSGNWVRINVRAQKQAQRPITPEYLQSLLRVSHDGLVQAQRAHQSFMDKRGELGGLEIPDSTKASTMGIARPGAAL